MKLRRLPLWVAVFALPCMLSSSVAPQMVQRQDLQPGQSLANTRQGSYVVRNVSLRRTSNDYAEFVRPDGTAFWAKVPPGKTLPEGQMTATILKEGDYYELLDVKSIEMEKAAFDYQGLHQGEPVVQIADDLKTVSSIPECDRGTAYINKQEEINRLECSTQSSASGSAS